MPLIIVECTRKLINGERNIRKMKSFYKELKNTSSTKNNTATIYFFEFYLLLQQNT